MKNLFSLLQESVRKYPDKAYVVDKGNQYTYAEVFQRVTGLAAHISSSINSGDRVLIYLDNSVEYIIAFYASLLTNAVVVPINKNTTLENIKFIVQDTSPAVILSNGVFLKRLQNNVGFDGCKEVNMDLVSDDKSGNGDDLITKLISDSDMPAVILYTSGTTRMPKGVTLTHRNLLANTNSILQYLGLSSEDSLLATINFCYSYGNSLLLTHTKAAGTIYIENRISYPIKVLEGLYSTRATGFSTVGSYINILLKQDGLRDFHLKHLRYITFAGESTNFEDIVKLNNLAPHIKIFVMYGQTEASARLSYLEPSMLFEKAGSIGKGIPGVILRVVDEDGCDVDPGEVGEIIASGENIMKGYWNNEAETKAVIRQGWLYTGDLATVDKDGYFYVKGRKDDIIKYMGHRISPVEVESAINSCEQVLESAVIGIDDIEGKLIKAYIVPKCSEYNEAEIAAHIRKLLPPFKRPQIMEFVDEIPRTANGKIKRSELRAINVQSAV